MLQFGSRSTRPVVRAMQVGPEDHVICALSGGVDSTVAATLVHKVLRDRLHCVFVDNGLLRYKVDLTIVVLNCTSL
jgi:GMP synthase PP-ATPase subunit